MQTCYNTVLQTCPESSILKVRLEAIGVKLTNIASHCYDSASNMSGEYRGVHTEIKKEAGDKTVYTHCYNHVLALVLKCSASDILLVVQVFTRPVPQNYDGQGVTGVGSMK